jgi:predicted GNAT family N-acyltransferase
MIINIKIPNNTESCKLKKQNPYLPPIFIGLPIGFKFSLAIKLKIFLLILNICSQLRIFAYKLFFDSIKSIKMENKSNHTLTNIIKTELIDNQDQIDLAFFIRRQVFVEEQHVSVERESMDDNESVHYLASYNELPAGAARFRKTEKGTKIERIAVLKNYRGKGIGEAILLKILDDVESEEKIYLHAQVNAIQFYIKNGFKTTDNYFVDAGIDHVEMDFIK